MLAHVALLLLVNPSPASPPPASARREELGFSERLGLGDLELRGERASQRVEFHCEAGWAPAAGSELRLYFEHSPDLDAERAFLAVSLNHGTLRSVRLEGAGLTTTELVIPLPETMLKPTNQIVFSVEQPVAREAGRAWTRILARSRISLLLARRPVAWSLADLPAPLLQRWSHGPRRLTVLMPSRPSLATIEATALAVANLCRRVAPHPVSLAFVRSPADADSPVLAVGTPGEQPELGRLALPSPLSLREGPGGATLAHRGQPLEPTLGMIALAKAESVPVLLVSGNSSEAVRKAGLGLLSAPRRSGDRVLLMAQVARPPGEPRRWKGYLPPSSRSTLSELSDDETELAVTRDTPARVRVRALPDARFLPYGHSLKLVFQTLPALGQDPDAALEVYWNEALIRQAQVRTLGAGPSFALALRLPSAALLADNELRISWNGRSGDPGPFVMLRAESELNLPREHVAQLPDLSRLRTGFYPLGLRPDLSDTVLVPPARAGDDGLAALAELAALLGRTLPTDQLAFRVRDAGSLGAVRASVHLLLLETAASAEAPELPLPDAQRLPRGDVLRRMPFLEERPSPWAPGRFVLRLRAPTPALLRAALRSLSRPAFLDRLSGDTAFLSAEGPLGYTLQERRTLREISYLRRLEAWLRDNWLALPAILAFVSGVLFMGLRVALGERRATRTPPGRADVPS